MTASRAAQPAAVDESAGAEAGVHVPELERQLATLLTLGYPALARAAGTPVTDQWLTERVRALLPALRDVPTYPPTPERVPFVLVASPRLVPVRSTMPLTSLSGRPGVVSHLAHDIERFRPIESAAVPDEPVYLLVDVERGSQYVGVRPQDAEVDLAARGRSPLTVDEGIALVTHVPASLETNHCFSLVASRCGDRRVPALWISKRAPMLGWCFAGAPHTWLGSASCGGRVAVPLPPD